MKKQGVVDKTNLLQHLYRLPRFKAHRYYAYGKYFKIIPLLICYL